MAREGEATEGVVGKDGGGGGRTGEDFVEVESERERGTSRGGRNGDEDEARTLEQAKLL